MSSTLLDRPELEFLNDYKYGWIDSDEAGSNAKRGLSEGSIREVSTHKGEPQWMLDYRLKAFKTFQKKPMPTWGADLSGVNFDEVKYFVQSTDTPAKRWQDLPPEILSTYDKLGIPAAERQRLVAGVVMQYESTSVMNSINKDLSNQGVIFMSTDDALKEHPDIFKAHFGTVVSSADNKFASLNASAWSGGSFLYVPPGVHVQIPLQAYFRINSEQLAQLERTLIVADEGSSVHYIEGCSAGLYSTEALHAAVVEIIVKKNASVKYTTIQNWSNNVYNLVTKRATVQEGGLMQWVDANIGAKVTAKYPSIYLMGEHARGETLSMAFAGPGQHQDTGAKMIHLAPHTSSSIVAKSIARGGGRAGYRGEVRMSPNAHHSSNAVRCDALLIDTISRSDTFPTSIIESPDVSLAHEASVSRVSEEQLFYLMSRGMSEVEAMSMIVLGFLAPITKDLPLEYSHELAILVGLNMAGAIG